MAAQSDSSQSESTKRGLASGQIRAGKVVSYAGKIEKGKR